MPAPLWVVCHRIDRMVDRRPPPVRPQTAPLRPRASAPAAADTPPPAAKPPRAKR